jgi:gluconate 5-dehydrogenase
LSDRPVALVTGASRGIGRAIALELANGGHRVALGGRDRPALASVRDEIESAGGGAMDIVVDVTDRATIDEAIEQIERQLGPIEVLVNNAGIQRLVQVCPGGRSTHGPGGDRRRHRQRRLGRRHRGD